MNNYLVEPLQDQTRTQKTETQGYLQSENTKTWSSSRFTLGYLGPHRDEGLPN